jgi:hypothetical protein
MSALESSFSVAMGGGVVKISSSIFDKFFVSFSFAADFRLGEDIGPSSAPKSGVALTRTDRRAKAYV